MRIRAIAIRRGMTILYKMPGASLAPVKVARAAPAAGGVRIEFEPGADLAYVEVGPSRWFDTTPDGGTPAEDRKAREIAAFAACEELIRGGKDLQTVIDLARTALGMERA